MVSDRVGEGVASANEMSQLELTCGSHSMSGKQLISHLLLLSCDPLDSPVELSDCLVFHCFC
jgi:hypothetical protein